jgi:hypothetical protein
VENALLEVVMHANVHSIEVCGFREVAHNTGSMLKQIEFSVNMGQREFGSICCGISIAVHSI